MKNVFFIGDVALDEYYETDYWPTIKDKILMRSLGNQMGGSIANAASVFTALGNKPYFLTALNSGAITQDLLAGLKEQGIDVSHMVFDETLPDAKCIIVLAEGEHTVLICTLGMERFDIRPETYEALKKADYIYTNFIEIVPMHYVDPETGKEMDAKDILTEIRKNGTQVWCDVDVAEYMEGEEDLFSSTDMIMVNEMGDATLAKRYGEDWKEKFFADGMKLIVITEAEAGCNLYRPGEEPIHVDGNKVEVTDVTGAGDTFGSALMHACMRSDDLALCAEYANFIAARAVTGLGARFAAEDPAGIPDFIRSCGGDPDKFRVFFE